MSRKRNEFGARGDKMLVDLMNAGGTAPSISATLTAAGIKGASRSTVGDRMRELRGAVATSRATTTRATAAHPASPPRSEPAGVPMAPFPDPSPLDDPELPSSPDDIPPNASVELLDKLIGKADTALTQAEDVKNLPLVGQLLRVSAFLAEARRKATPAAKADPNDNPDMVSLGKQVAERLHKMIDLVATAAEDRQG